MRPSMAFLVFFLLLASAPLRGGGIFGQGSPEGVLEDFDGAATGSLATPSIDSTRRYRFVPDPGAEVVSSPYFDLVRDTPDFDNFGNVFLPGGTCFGFTLGIYEHYQRIIYPFLGKQRSVAPSDVQKVDGELDASGRFLVTRDGRRIRKGLAEERFPLRIIHLDPTSRGDQRRFEFFRLRSLTSSEATKGVPYARDVKKTRERIRALFASLSIEQFDGIFLRRFGAEAAFQEWTRDLKDPAIGLGIVSFSFESGGGHAVLTHRCQVGKAVPEDAPDSAAGLAATAFWLVDPNKNYVSEEAGAEDYILYFHQAKRMGFSPRYRDSYGSMILHQGAFHGADEVRYRIPPVGEKLWELPRGVRQDIGNFSDSDQQPATLQRLQELYESRPNIYDPQSLALDLELQIAAGTGDQAAARRDLAFVRGIAPRPDFERLLEEAKLEPTCPDAPCLVEAFRERAQIEADFPWAENGQRIRDLKAELAGQRRGTALWYATRDQIRFFEERERKASEELAASLERRHFLQRFPPELRIREVRRLLGR